jgi:predicted small lipoprotein YifL
MRLTTLVLLASLVALTACARKPQNFDTPEAAVQALVEAAKTDGDRALLAVLGKEGKPIIDSGDEVADQNGRREFLEAYTAAHSLDTSTADVVTLEVGPDKWPFPVPIVKQDGKWHFDTESGAEEIINRRVGENELDTIQSCLAYADAQREYYMRNPENDPFLHYAGRLISTEGKKDGLYWPAADGEEPSPIGEGFADARAEGYLQEGTMKGVPFHGYIYRLLTRQGPNAAGGAYDYLVDGKLLGGFAAVAFPAEYGNSGVMTFMVNHDGVVFSKDLGADTAKLALAMEEFNPGQDWKREAEDKAATAAN